MTYVEKTIEIPTGTEIDVTIDIDDLLDDVENDDILDILVRDIGCKQVFRKMQIQHDFEKEDIEEAYGQTFDSDITPEAILEKIEYGSLDSQDVISHLPMVDLQEYAKGSASSFLMAIDDEDIIEYYHEKIKKGQGLLINDVIEYVVKSASAFDKLRIMKTLLLSVEDGCNES